jgi:GH35 family endo-1,4-beta-xylanase
MGHNVRIGFLGAMIIAPSLFFSAFANVASGGYDYSHRRSKCKVIAKPNATVHAKLVLNHFAFGASINKWSFDTLQKGIAGVTQNYGDAFIRYFDVATPENEFKWSYVQGDSVKGPPNWTDADFLLEFCRENNIDVRAHNLFWVEKRDWIPKWTWTLSQTAFKAALQERINDAMTRLKGKVIQWDIVNEIIHGYGGQTPSITMFDTMSGDPNIFSWILDEARKIDKTTPFVINDYNLIPGDQSQIFINKCKPLVGKFDVIGDEGHFGNNIFNRSTIDSKAQKLADGLGNKKIWCTEVDWSFDASQSSAKMEEIMRTCFANKNIEGLILWTWAKRKMWVPMTNVLVDSLLVETPTGKKYREVRSEWKTDTTGKADGSGQFSFIGYQGRYQIISDGDTQCVHLFPNDSTAVLSDKQRCHCPSVPTMPTGIALQPRPIRLQGNKLLGDLAGRKLWLVAYSLSGKRLSEIQVDGTVPVRALPAGCHAYRIRSADKTLFTGINWNRAKGM